MRRRPNLTLRRILLAVMVLTVASSAGIYVVRRWKLEILRSTVPSSLPEGVAQQTERFRFSRSEGGQVVFAVEAQRSEEREGDVSVLEGVALRIYGRDGERGDSITAQQCEYRAEQGEIDCPGAMEIHLRSSAEARDDSGGLAVLGRGLHYSSARQLVWSDNPVDFHWEQGTGRADGLQYRVADGIAELTGAVGLTIEPGGDVPLTASAGGLRYYASDRRLLFSSPLRASFPGGNLQAGRLEVRLDDAFRTTRIEAAGMVRIERERPDDRWRLEADGLVIAYSARGVLEWVKIAGPLEFAFDRPSGGGTFHGLRARLEYEGGDDPARIRVEGGARLGGDRGDANWLVRAEWIEWARTAPENRRSVLRAGMNAGVEVRIADGTRLGVDAESLQLDLAGMRPRGVAARQRTVFWHERAGVPRRETRGEELDIELGPDVALVSAEQRGDVRLTANGITAQGGRLTYDGEARIAKLTEQPQLLTPLGKTRADRIQYVESEGAFVGIGNVRSTFESQGRGTRSASAAPIQLAADSMRASAAQGKVEFTGNVRMWRGDSRIEAGTLEYSSESTVWNAGEGVRMTLLLTGMGQPGSSGTVRVDAARLRYDPTGGKAAFEGSVSATTTRGTLATDSVEVILSAQDGQGERVERILGTGGVRGVFSGRRVTSEFVEFDVTRGTVLFQGNPRLEDESGISTSASRLTLFLADGTLLAESEDGSRTVTHRPAGK